MIEAMFSFTLDKDKGQKGTISGYSKLWGWSRWKVRRFIENITSKDGHFADIRLTLNRHPIHFIDKGFWNNPDILPTEDRHFTDTTNKPNPKPEPKKKKSKPKKAFIPPKIEDVKIYFHENGFKIDVAENAFHYYAVADWKDSRGNKIKNWKQKMRGVWFKDENKINGNGFNKYTSRQDQNKQACQDFINEKPTMEDIERENKEYGI